jgi:hypothetical protein
MKRRPKTIISTKIEVNKDRTYRTNDVHDFAGLIFPNKNAVDLRTAFILIFLSIKYSRERRISTSELENMRKKKALEISPKSLWKARATMARIGLIAKREGFWQFSTKFGKSLGNLAEKTSRLMVPDGSNAKERKDWFLLDCAKGMKF